ncbi:hypothetical protein QYE76_048197 [Lolium multiflorum]|uniref:Apyrase n=1 Tax=Lolium multiflorum TaxID=4521 RepID=A0AAD8VBF6_LOLMU|nr:hypothetical protein QYE76_048197 [Lolium multiflorum]
MSGSRGRDNPSRATSCTPCTVNYPRFPAESARSTRLSSPYRIPPQPRGGAPALPHRRRAPRPRTPSTAGRAHPLMRRPNARVEPPAQAQEQTLASAPASKMAAQRQRSSSSSSLGRRHLAGALAFLAATAFALLLLLPRSSPPSYGVVIDAGSTGSRVHVIAYRAGPLPRLDWTRTASLKAAPGLSSFAADPGTAGASIAPLLEFARRRVPRDSWARTEVRLMATAGLRLLDAATAEAVLESCRRLLRESGFQFQDEWATMISGAEEGIYAWVAANYALGTLGGATQDTTGIIELGNVCHQ